MEIFVEEIGKCLKILSELESKLKDLKKQNFVPKFLKGDFIYDESDGSLYTAVTDSFIREGTEVVDIRNNHTKLGRISILSFRKLVFQEK